MEANAFIETIIINWGLSAALNTEVSAISGTKSLELRLHT